MNYAAMIVAAVAAIGIIIVYDFAFRRFDNSLLKWPIILIGAVTCLAFAAQLAPNQTNVIEEATVYVILLIALYGLIRKFLL